MEELNSYILSRQWFDWCFDNPEKVTPNHTALYFFAIEHCNRLGWKEKFGLPMEMAKDAIGIKNYRTYAKTFSDLVEWGFIKIIQKSKNQYSSNIIAIVKNTKAQSKALDKALQKHGQKQGQSTVGIDKPINNITFKHTNKEESESKDSFACSDENDSTGVEDQSEIEKEKSSAKKEKDSAIGNQPPGCETPVPDIESIQDGNNGEDEKFLKREEIHNRIIKEAFDESPISHYSQKCRDVFQQLCKTDDWIKKKKSQLKWSLKRMAKYDEEFFIYQVEKVAERGWQGLVFSSTDRDYKDHLRDRKQLTVVHNGSEIKNTSTYPSGNYGSRQQAIADRKESRDRLGEEADRILAS